MDTVQAGPAEPTQKNLFGHPRGLFVLFFTEMWERFSYYGMRAILILYMTKYLAMSTEDAGGVYGDYTGLVYLTPLFGGFLADRYLGLRPSIVLGGIIMAIGQFLLALGFLRHLPLFYLGLILLIIGNGFFKPNISTLVGQLYSKDDPRRDGAFSIFYMGINLGAALSPLVCGTIGQAIDWHWGFFSAGAGMILGVLTILIWGPRYLGDRGMRPAPRTMDTGEKIEPLTGEEKKRLCIVFGIGAALSVAYAAYGYASKSSSIPSAVRSTLWPMAVTVVATIWVFLMGRTEGAERRRVNVIFLVGIFVTVFWAAFEQAGSSLTLFADRSTRLSYFGRSFESSNFQSVNAFTLVIFAPVFSWVWTWLARRGKDPSSPVKMALGMFFNAISFAIMVGAALAATGGGKVSPDWLVVAYVFQTFGELSLSPVGLSMVTRIAPARFAAMVMGIWFLTNAFGNKIAGTFGSLYDKYPASHLFGAATLVLAVMGVVLLAFVPRLKRMMGGVK